MRQPLFSVVIPCFRATATLAEALRSVLDQSEQDFGILLVDDGCPDDSAWAGLASVDGQDCRIRVLRQSNAGPSAARNHGVRQARGALVAFLDADDTWSAMNLSLHRAAFELNPSLGISYSKVRFCDGLLKWGGRVSSTAEYLGLADVLGDNPTCTTSNLVIRRDVLTESLLFDETLTHAEDQDLIARILADGVWQMSGLNHQMVNYRMSVAGLSADLEQMEAGWLAMLTRLRARAPRAVAAAEREGRARFYRYLARRALRTGHSPRTAFRLFLRAVGASPSALLRHQPRRSALTALGVAGALVLPERFIRPIVAR